MICLLSQADRTSVRELGPDHKALLEQPVNPPTAICRKPGGNWKN